MIDCCTVAEEAASFLSICFCQIQQRFFIFYVTVSHQGKNNNIYVCLYLKVVLSELCKNCTSNSLASFGTGRLSINRCHKNGSAHPSLINILLKHRFCEKLSPKKSHVSDMKYGQWKVRNKYICICS